MADQITYRMTIVCDIASNFALLTVPPPARKIFTTDAENQNIYYYLLEIGIE